MLAKLVTKKSRSSRAQLLNRGGEGLEYDSDNGAESGCLRTH